MSIIRDILGAIVLSFCLFYMVYFFVAEPDNTGETIPIKIKLESCEEENRQLKQIADECIDIAKECLGQKI